MNSELEVTRWLQRASSGDRDALDEVARQLYSALKRTAQGQLRHAPGETTLSATALVNEAWLRLFGPTLGTEWKSREHLLAVAARAMRGVLVDKARRRGAAKRPQASDRLQLGEVIEGLEGEVDTLELVECLDLLEQLDPRQAMIVSLRFFVGLNADEIAEAIGVSAATVSREWRTARAWLRRELELPPATTHPEDGADASA